MREHCCKWLFAQRVSRGGAGGTAATSLPSLFPSQHAAPDLPLYYFFFSLNTVLQNIALATLGFLLVASGYSCCVSPPSLRQTHRSPVKQRAFSSSMLIARLLISSMLGSTLDSHSWYLHKSHKSFPCLLWVKDGSNVQLLQCPPWPPLEQGGPCVSASFGLQPFSSFCKNQPEHVCSWKNKPLSSGCSPELFQEDINKAQLWINTLTRYLVHPSWRQITVTLKVSSEGSKDSSFKTARVPLDHEKGQPTYLGHQD